MPRSLRACGRRHLAGAVLALAFALGAVAIPAAQQPSFARLAGAELDAKAPSVRVRGTPGTMSIRDTACMTRPDAEVRRRAIAIAVQEWAWFGFAVVDQTQPRRIERPAAPRAIDGAERPRRSRRFRWLDPDESARVATSIAGFWAATPEGTWILENQNRAWNGPDGVASRWQDPWSAAFISWVMCESGLSTERFRRAVAHHVYIDQAIRARDGREAAAAFVAYDIGERVVEPGDLICSGRRPAYRSVAERRRQMGEGARTHCDIVVHVDEPASRLLTIGGNVRGTVALKLMRGERTKAGTLHPMRADEDGGIFVHLKLRIPAAGGYTFYDTPTVRALACAAAFEIPARLTAASIIPARLDPASSSCDRGA